MCFTFLFTLILYDYQFQKCIINNLYFQIRDSSHLIESIIINKLFHTSRNRVQYLDFLVLVLGLLPNSSNQSKMFFYNLITFFLSEMILRKSITIRLFCTGIFLNLISWTSSRQNFDFSIPHFLIISYQVTLCRYVSILFFRIRATRSYQIIFFSSRLVAQKTPVIYLLNDVCQFGRASYTVVHSTFPLF